MRIYFSYINLLFSIYYLSNFYLFVLILICIVSFSFTGFFNWLQKLRNFPFLEWKIWLPANF